MSRSCLNASPPGRERGLVLILIIFVVALVAILATGLLSRQSLDIRRASNIAEQNQARSYALGGEFFARSLLLRDWREDQQENAYVDHVEDAGDEPWGVNAVQLPIDLNTGLEGQLDDLMGRLNLNALVVVQGEGRVANPLQLERLKRLLQALPELTLPPELTAESFVDWMDSDQQSTGYRGAEDDVYLLKDPPYRSAGSPFNDISELWLIEGMTAEVFAALKDRVAVLPTESAKLNINTAGTEVLQAYLPGLTAQGAQQILDERKNQKGFKSVQEFLQLQALAGLKNLPVNELQVNSQYFLATIRAIVDGRSYRLESKLYRDNAGKIEVLRRDFGKKTALTKPVVVVN